VALARRDGGATAVVGHVAIFENPNKFSHVAPPGISMMRQPTAKRHN